MAVLVHLEAKPVVPQGPRPWPERITPEIIRTAYAETGLRPVNCRYGDGVRTGCPLTALSVYLGYGPLSQSNRHVFLTRYNVDFMRGVDGLYFGSGDGYSDGLTVRRELFR